MEMTMLLVNVVIAILKTSRENQTTRFTKQMGVVTQRIVVFSLSKWAENGPIRHMDNEPSARQEGDDEVHSNQTLFYHEC